MLTAKVIFVLAIVCFPLTPLAQLFSLPECIQDCIEQSPDTNCEITDIGCLCRASAGNFLPDTIICMRSNCDNDLDIDILLAPLELACDLAGAPIPESAINNAAAQASSQAGQVTMTVTVGESSATGGSEASNTGEVTVTKTQGGSTIVIAYPVTEWRTTTLSGPGSTITSVLTSSLSGVSVPVIVVTTDSNGLTYTTTTTELGPISTYTTTNSKGHTITQKTTYTEVDQQTISPSAGSETTSLAAQVTSSSETGAKSTKTSTPDNDSNDSSPFKNTNLAIRIGIDNWLGCGVLMIMVIVWF